MGHQRADDLDVRQGFKPLVSESLARHATIKLTLDRYTHLAVVDLTNALNRLPELPVAGAESQVKATGTDGEAHAPYAPQYAPLPVVSGPDLSSDGNAVRSDSRKPAPRKSSDQAELALHVASGRAMKMVCPTGFEPVACSWETAAQKTKAL
jgi:hypothetical protein